MGYKTWSNTVVVLIMGASMVIVLVNIQSMQTAASQYHMDPAPLPLTTRTSSIKSSGHVVAGLDCDRFGGPSKEIAAEMVYWSDIPQDASFVSPLANYGPDPKYLTFEPDEGGWNNIRMSMETAVVLAQAMGRILVLPPERPIYLLQNDEKATNNRFTFKDFFHFDSLAEEHTSVQIITMEEFLKREAMTGNLRDKQTRQVSYPPGNETGMSYKGADPWHQYLSRKEKPFFKWLRNVTEAPLWDFSAGLVAIPETPGPQGLNSILALRPQVRKPYVWKKSVYHRNPVPVDAPLLDRLKQMLAHRTKIFLYEDYQQNTKVIHLMGDNASGARLLTHFYTFVFFESWKQDLWTKRFVRDHLRYIDEIQCAAARVVHAMREKARENGNEKGEFETFHIRRGDFQYKQTRIPPEEIYENVKGIFVENSTVFVATDERKKQFFDPLRAHYKLYFLDDFQHLIKDLNKNYYGMLDQRIASRGRTFAGAYFSTFTGYIYRMRGYHAQKSKLPGYNDGEMASYFYTPRENVNDMHYYEGVYGPTWGREFALSWRDIDHDIA